VFTQLLLLLLLLLCYIHLLFYRCSFPSIPGNFSDPTKLNVECEACLDGYFTQYLVRNRGWSYSRLPMDGLRSLIFDGLSPTYCIASHGVWLDHAHSSQSGCLAPDTVQTLYARDILDLSNRVYDWASFYAGYNFCLRLSELAYATAINDFMG
jgi:hypothetical protein